jgi:pSer/pThr/pTyr-binding forkhead associated (FHA) protein
MVAWKKWALQSTDGREYPAIMRAILEVLEGPLTGRRIEVYPGHSISFGRNVRADIAVPGDGYMSGRHFAVENTGEACFVHDLGSSNGTFVNGTRVDRVPAATQDLIAAGSSKFRLVVEQEDPAAAEGLLLRTGTMMLGGTRESVSSGDRTQVAHRDDLATTHVITPPGVEVPHRWQGFTAPQVAVLEALYAPSGSLYAYLNGTREQLIQAFVEASGEQYLPLGQALVGGRAVASSYLVALPKTANLWNVLMKDGWGRQWGVYCSSPASFEQVAAHLYAFSTVQTGTGVPLNLPLYDPQFLQTFLSSMSPAEGLGVFGPIRHFFFEAQGGSALYRCSPSAQGVAIETLTIKP